MRAAAVIVAVAVAIAAPALAQGTDDGDECAPRPGERHARADQCCRMKGAMPEAVKRGFDACKGKYPRPPRPTGPPPTGPPPTPSPEMRGNMSCMVQCAMTEAGLVKDGVLDEAAFKRAVVANDSAMAAAVETAKTECLASYKRGIDTTLECKSGADEMMKCMMRATFVACPAAAWNSSDECEQLMSRVKKCPMMPVMMGGPKGPPGRRQGY